MKLHALHDDDKRVQFAVWWVPAPEQLPPGKKPASIDYTTPPVAYQSADTALAVGGKSELYDFDLGGGDMCGGTQFVVPEDVDRIRIGMIPIDRSGNRGPAREIVAYLR